MSSLPPSPPLTPLPLAEASFEGGSNFCDDEKDRKDHCKHLVTPDRSSHSGSSECEACEEPTPKPAPPTPPPVEEVTGTGSTFSDYTDAWEVTDFPSTVEPVWPPGKYCFLLEFFFNYSLTLDIEIQIIFQQWINETQITIVQNESLSSYQILSSSFLPLLPLILLPLQSRSGTRSRR